MSDTSTITFTSTTTGTHQTTPSSGRTRRRLAGLLGATAACAMFVVAPTPAEAAGASRVDFTVAESLAVTTGEVISDGGLDDLGCLTADVQTSDLTTTERGGRTIFAGVKTIECDAGTLTLSFRASVRGCATSDAGVWRVTGGTGDFAGARGGGRLVGTYTGGAATACDSTGIDDRYTGVLVLR